MKHFLSAFLFVIAFSTSAQNQLRGTVTDSESKSPLPNVYIYLHDLRKGTITESDGTFTFDGLPKGKFLVEFKLVGYAPLVQNVYVDGQSNINVALNVLATELNEVVVTGISHSTELKRNPMALATINNQSLQENTSTNLIDNISNKPGVNQISTGAAISKPVIRGLSFNRIITLVDGIRQEGQQWGDEHGIEIDEYSIDRVEIIKGAGSLMYGGDGLGGVVHFLGAKPEAEGFIKSKWISNYQSNNGLISNSISNTGNIKGIYWQARTSEKIAKAYSNAFDGKVFNSGFHELDFSGTVGVNKNWGYTEFSASSFSQSVGLVEGDRDTDGNFIKAINDNGVESEVTATKNDLNSYSLSVPNQTIHHTRFANTSNFYFSKSRLQLNTAYQRNQRKEYGDVLKPGSPNLYFDLNTINHNLIYYFPQIKNWEFSIGASGMYQQNNNRGTEFIIPEYSLLDWGSFVFAKQTLGKFDVSGGVRFDHRHIHIESLYTDDSGTPTLKFKDAELNFSNVSASAGITYEFSKYITGKLNAARGFRAPNISELASNGKHEGTLRYEYGGYKLNSETSFQVDAGTILNLKHITVELSVFQNTIGNYIFTEKLLSKAGTDSIPDPTDPVPAYQYTQGKAQLRGGELMIDLHPHPLDWLHFENSFSYVQGINISKQSIDSAKYLPFIPAGRIQSELRANTKKIDGFFKEAFFKIEFNHYLKQNKVLLENKTETVTPSYSIWNIGVGTEVVNKKGVELFTFYFSVNNLFDLAYQNHLSRLKYAAENLATGRTGVFSMGRNFNFKIIVPITIKKPRD